MKNKLRIEPGVIFEDHSGKQIVTRIHDGSGEWDEPQFWAKHMKDDTGEWLCGERYIRDHLAEPKLRLFNGRGYCCENLDDKRWLNAWENGCIPYAYAAANSIADLLRLIEEYTGRKTSRHEIVTYWNHDAWGRPMDGKPRTRGLWISFSKWSDQKPERVK